MHQLYPIGNVGFKIKISTYKNIVSPICKTIPTVTIRCNPLEESLLWIGVFVHRFWIGGGVAPVGAGLEEVVVQGIADFEKDIGVDPFAAHDFVEVITGVANLLCQPGDASPLPREFRLDGLSDMKAVG